MCMLCHVCALPCMSLPVRVPLPVHVPLHACPTCVPGAQAAVGGDSRRDQRNSAGCFSAGRAAEPPPLLLLLPCRFRFRFPPRAGEARAELPELLGPIPAGLHPGRTLIPAGPSSRRDPRPGGAAAMATGRAAKSTRTVVIAGVPDGLLQDDVMADILTIHFQKSRNNGGDVEEVTYPTGNKGVAYVTFEDQEVVESVLKKDDHRLEDKRLSQPYPLRVTPYCEKVFSSVTSVLNMAVFKEQFVLEDLVEEMKKQSRDLSFGPLQSDGQIAVQGSFPAIKVLRDFLLLKAKSLSEKDSREESKSHQRLRRRLQEDRRTTERRNFVPDGDGGKQVVVLDTDIYHYMKHFFPWIFQENDVAVSAVTDGDITTVCVENAGRADAGQVSSVKKKIEDQSIKLHSILRKIRVSFKECPRDEKQRHKWVCERLKSCYPQVLVIPYDAHIEVIGFSSDIFEFTKEMSSKSLTR
ncbi:RNA-binding protein 43 [Chiroxiphia lanceolata]|uniref:RNA-binding protein 43 n=1 Tax=Chiroxiphia lanceolata TaxID=296741 RepID=UPI0013CEF551|nr:RNA-binding protein 43 [Chiroxiphia lanceolata]